jgi:hypothetical protein
LGCDACPKDSNWLHTACPLEADAAHDKPTQAPENEIEY